MNDRFQARSGYSKDVNFKTANSSNRPGAALGAYSTCNEYAAVIKRIARQLNTSLRASQYMQVSGNIALMLPIPLQYLIYNRRITFKD